MSNGPPIIECQVDWIIDAIKKMREQHIKSIEAEQESANKWREDIQKSNSMTLFPLTNSWYMGANIPGKKREMLNYLGGLEMYENACRDALDNWDGFKLVNA